jgi:nucleoside-diphosphate-sugar epimerase
VRHLLDLGHRVINIDRKPGDDPRARFVDCDVRQRESVAPILAECDGVCHLAEIPNVHSGARPDEVYWKNTRSTSVVLQAAADLHLRHAVYASSCQVYGCWGEPNIVPLRFPVKEEDPVRPQNAYAASKAANEIFARYLSDSGGASMSIFRFPWVVTKDFDEKAIRHFEREDGPLRDGFNTFIHATDLASAFGAALEKQRPGCEIYNLSAADILSVFPLVERMGKHHPAFPPLPSKWPDFKSPISVEKAERTLGWSPKWSFLEYFRSFQARSGH